MAFSDVANNIKGSVVTFVSLLVAVFGAILGLVVLLNGLNVPALLTGSTVAVTASGALLAALSAFAIWAVTLLAVDFTEILPH